MRVKSNQVCIWFIYVQQLDVNPPKQKREQLNYGEELLFTLTLYMIVVFLCSS